jgi:excisionase family DNA binding protein
MRVGNAKDAAKLLRVHVNRVYEMAQAGELPQLRRVGPELRFDMDELEAWLRGDRERVEVRDG